MKKLAKFVLSALIISPIFVVTSHHAKADVSVETLAAGGYYRLKTQFRGINECLEGNQASSPVHGGSAFMDQCQNVSGQLWKFEPAGNGYFRLKTQFRGEDECLEGNQAGSPVHNGSAFMDQCQNVSGQLWQIIATEY